jgi:hypothetical protein
LHLLIRIRKQADLYLTICMHHNIGPPSCFFLRCNPLSHMLLVSPIPLHNH